MKEDATFFSAVSSINERDMKINLSGTQSSTLLIVHNF